MKNKNQRQEVWEILKVKKSKTKNPKVKEKKNINKISNLLLQTNIKEFIEVGA